MLLLLLSPRPDTTFTCVAAGDILKQLGRVHESVILGRRLRVRQIPLEEKGVSTATLSID